MKGKTPILENSEIMLRPIDPESDYLQWFDVMLDPDMHLWTGNTVPESPEEVKELLQKYNCIAQLLPWAVVLKSSHEMIGTYWLTIPETDGKGFLISIDAQRIAKKFWRTGITTQVRNLAYEYAFNTLYVDEIHAGAWADNINSCKSMEKSGFVLLEQHNRMFSKYEKEMVENHYVLYKKDWLTFISK